MEEDIIHHHHLHQEEGFLLIEEECHHLIHIIEGIDIEEMIGHVAHEEDIIENMYK